MANETPTISVPRWSLSGVCTEVRELTTKEGKVWMYVVKIMAMGGVYELQTKDGALFRQAGEGAEYEAAGVFDHFNGKIRFVVQKLKAIA